MRVVCASIHLIFAVRRQPKLIAIAPLTEQTVSIKDFPAILVFRINLSKGLGFRATGGIFTSAKAQKAAERAGMECLYHIPYKKFGKRCNIVFDSDAEDLKIFAVRTE